MTSIQYTDSKQITHNLEVDDDASETEYLTIFNNYTDLNRLGTIESKREIAFAVCQLIPNLPHSLGYFEGEYNFKMPPVGLVLEIAKLVAPKMEKLGSVTQRLKNELKLPEMSPEEKEAIELEARLAELKAKQNAAGVGFGKA